MPGEVRAPGLRVLADGVALPEVISADVSSNNHLAADRFRVRLAAQGGVLDAVMQAGVRVRVQAGLDGTWSDLVLGEADSVGLDPVRGVVEVEGRDLSALFIDTRVDETFANRTASEIAAELAGRHGLEVSGASTSTLVGRYYQSEHDRTTTGQFSRAMSEWDLLAFLAGREGFGLFVQGEVLHFGTEAEEAVVLRPGDCLSLQLDRALTMERQIEVTVRSWDQKGAQAVVQTVQGGGTGRQWKHAVVRPNLPPDEAQRIAERTLADLMRHQWTARVSLPGRLGLSARSQVQLEGTGTAWDRAYAVSEASCHLDVRRGFTQTLCLQGVA